MTQLTLTREALHQLLKPTALFTSTDPLVPILGGVLVRFEGGKEATAWSTDRYTAALTRVEVTAEASGPITLLIHKDDIKQLLTMVKLPARGHERYAPVELTRNGTRLEVRAGVVGAQFELLDDTAYPTTIDRIFRDALDSTPGTPTAGFNAAYLARLKDVAAAYGNGAVKDLKITLGPNPRKPALATIGDHFLALFMPVGNGKYSHSELSDWNTFLSTPIKAAS